MKDSEGALAALTFGTNGLLHLGFIPIDFGFCKAVLSIYLFMYILFTYYFVFPPSCIVMYLTYNIVLV